MPIMPPTHRPRGWRSEGERKREVDQRRGSAAARGYGRRWQKAREGYLRKHPLCIRCKRAGFITAATVVDHIRPHRGDSQLFWDSSNWQPLCKRCHDRKTAASDGGFGRRRREGGGQKSGAARP